MTSIAYPHFQRSCDIMVGSSDGIFNVPNAQVASHVWRLMSSFYTEGLTCKKDEVVDFNRHLV